MSLLYSTDPKQIFRDELIAAFKTSFVLTLYFLVSLAFIKGISHIPIKEISFGWIDFYGTYFLSVAILSIRIFIRVKQGNQRIELRDSAITFLRNGNTVRKLNPERVMKVFFSKSYVHSNRLFHGDTFVALHYLHENRSLPSAISLGPKSFAEFQTFKDYILKFNKGAVFTDFVNGPEKTLHFRLKKSLFRKE